MLWKTNGLEEQETAEDIPSKCCHMTALTKLSRESLKWWQQKTTLDGQWHAPQVSIKKGKISGNFLILSENHEQGAWQLQHKEVLFILKHITIRPNKLELSGTETNCRIYLLFEYCFSLNNCINLYRDLLHAYSFKKHGMAFCYCRCKKAGMKT